ncbi:UDP-3-O-(3-hydroxymyristoyl)glucosamine N-acyltransferase [Candidatus Symbiobacter mobilis]|uniref:UDP-3-O-acylglucosamine N-acyltransferase n=1 Tax=Candidatus Symbiobacter mobilis CR TaxID=946483 RepID=U5N4B3_9BURK|nr:UDP-3-O-(3-hydroxymyristoyl)glucosamine N-acyltransferase [Candidatus Symbiobacter mobilis]AGX86162.1 UDP-3-O-[3-hydroxymyristoyl] glucosamine N-acyltransferase [Candidatus Symbiobacter mobilis CR]
MLRVGAVVDELGGELHGDADRVIAGILPLHLAGPTHLSFLSHPRYRRDLEHSQAGCVIVPPDMVNIARQRGDCIVAQQPYLYFARLTQLWKRMQRQGTEDDGPRIHPSAVIDPSATIDPSARIGPLCTVGERAVVGADTVLVARVSVGERCVLGSRCLVHPGVVLGADGFGFAQDGAEWVKIEHLGAVRIGNDVEIGANTCIDRGALLDTVIEDGVKLDNLIQIAHNVRIGPHTALAGCVGVAGSADIGARCTIGGGAVVLGHLRIADDVHISAATVVTHSLPKPGQYSGIFPIDDNAAWEKNAATLKQLSRLRDRVRKLESLSPPLSEH